MGQYYKIVNLDKREYLHPHRFGDGLKLLEFGCSPNGTMTALSVLLASSNGRGGGDLRTSNATIPGRWCGDRIAVVGDYTEENEPMGDIYRRCMEHDPTDKDCLPESEHFRDISYEALLCILDDRWICEEWMKRPRLPRAMRDDAAVGNPHALAILKRLSLMICDVCKKPCKERTRRIDFPSVPDEGGGGIFRAPMVCGACLSTARID